MYGHVQPSYTSMKENEAIVSTKWTEITEEAEDDKHELVDEKVRRGGDPRMATRWAGD